MRHRNQPLALWLSCCLLLFPARSLAQAGFPLVINHGATPATTSAEVAASQHSPETVTLPAGTHLLMRLTSALHTTSATPGAGIYLETLFPVSAEGRVVIPEHTRVLGLVEFGRRPGRVQG